MMDKLKFKLMVAIILPLAGQTTAPISPAPQVVGCSMSAAIWLVSRRSCFKGDSS